MTDFPSYAYGTVTIDAAGTVVTGTDTIWSGVNARAGDDITVDGHTVIIVDVTDETHIKIDAWPYDAVTDAEYKIVQRSPLRFVGGVARADLTQLLSTLKAKGLLWYLPEEYDEPDDAKPPLTADDDQGILRISTGELWVMQGGAWVSAGTFKGLNPRGDWAAGTYNVNDIVSHGGTAYIALDTTTAEPPSADWMELGAKGADGGAVTIHYQFGGFGAGKLRFNQSTQNASSYIAIGVVDAFGVDHTAILASLVTGTSAHKQVLRIFKRDDPTKFLLFYVTNIAPGDTDEDNVFITGFGGSSDSPFASGDDLVLAFSPVGDKGDTGSVGPVPFQPVAPWVTSVAYTSDAPASFVFQGGNAYQCLISHTSGASFNTDLSSGKWGIVASKGLDGTGTGDVQGPSSSADGALAVFDGLDGKHIKQLSRAAFRSFLSTDDFGCAGDGVTDDTSAFQSAVTAAAGGALRVVGMVGLSSSVTVPSNICIFGASLNDGFIALGSNEFGATGLLNSANSTNVQIDGLFFKGNLTEPEAFSTGAIAFTSDDTNVADMDNLQVTNCSFESFKTNRWISFVIKSGDSSMKNINVSGNRIVAVPGCATTDAQSNVQGNTFCTLWGNTAKDPSGFDSGDMTGAVYNVTFANNKCIGYGLSGLLTGQYKVGGVYVGGNTTLFMGNNTLAVDRQYTYLFYNSDDTRSDPYWITIIGNVGRGHHSNAVYLAGGKRCTVSGNVFDFTFPSGLEPTLPHGAAIACNGATDVAVTGNTLTNALVGVALVGLSFRAGNYLVQGNLIRSSAASTSGQTACGILLSGDTTGVDQITTISSNNIEQTASGSVGILFQTAEGAKFGTIILDDNTIRAVDSGISTGSPRVAGKRCSISNTTIIGGQSRGARLVFDMPLRINNLSIDMTGSTTSGAIGAYIDAADIDIDGMTIREVPSSADYSFYKIAPSSRGTMRNVNIYNTSKGLGGSTTFGEATPDWSAQTGEFVQNLLPVAAGSSGSEYIVSGWVFASGAWKEVRTLTGG